METLQGLDWEAAWPRALADLLLLYNLQIQSSAKQGSACQRGSPIPISCLFMEKGPKASERRVLLHSDHKSKQSTYRRPGNQPCQRTGPSRGGPCCRPVPTLPSPTQTGCWGLQLSRGFPAPSCGDVLERQANLHQSPAAWTIQMTLHARTHSLARVLGEPVGLAAVPGPW